MPSAHSAESLKTRHAPDSGPIRAQSVAVSLAWRSCSDVNVWKRVRVGARKRSFC